MRLNENNHTMTKQFDVIIIGGGATGAGVARDCALRGIRALLLERFDIATVCSTAVRAMPLQTASPPRSASARI